jgi:hypothetical protein
LLEKRHQLAVDPIGSFLKEAIAEVSVESDKTFKDILYRAYKQFCNEHELAVESDENFAKILKGKRFEFQDGRESTGKRRRYWKGVKLADKYDRDRDQQTLENVVSEVEAETSVQGT